MDWVYIYRILYDFLILNSFGNVGSTSILVVYLLTKYTILIPKNMLYPIPNTITLINIYHVNIVCNPVYVAVLYCVFLLLV
jgi:hypothetical protein